LVQRAFAAYCAKCGGSPTDRIAKEKWYRQELIARFGICTTKELEPIIPDILDALLLHFALLADDQYWIDRATRGPEIRAMWQLKQAMDKTRINWQYVHGIALQMGFLTSTDDGANIERTISELPIELITKIISALRTHLYRSAKRKEPVHA
jgi:hypothetical protein